MKKIIPAILAILTLSSCLKLQTNEPYEGKSPDRNVNMTCWEYLQSRPELFTSMVKGIELCGLEDCYKQNTQPYTYLLLTESAIAPKVNNAIESGNDVAIAELKAILLFHIIRGYYDAYTNIDFSVTYCRTLLNDEDARMSLCVTDHDSNRSYYGRLAAMTDCGSSTVRYAVESNYLATNGPMHVFDAICSYKD